MSHLKNTCGPTWRWTLPVLRFAFVGCALLFTAAFSNAQTPPPAPSYSAWQPPLTKTNESEKALELPPTRAAMASFEAPVALQSPSFPASTQSSLPSKTNLTNLQPPRDIFTQQAPQSTESFSARSLNESGPRIASSDSFASRSDFSLQNAMPEAFGSGVAQANLDSPSFNFPSPTTKSSASSSLSGLANVATEKLGDAKTWLQTKAGSGGWLEKISSMFGGADIKKIGGSLAIVIGGYLGLVWLLRMINPAASQGIPSEVLEIVGNAPLDSRQNLQLVRLGSKLLLMLQSPDGTQPIGEVTDPAEVEHLVSLCNGKTRSATSAIGSAINRYRSNPSQANHSSHSNLSIPSLNTANSSAANLSPNQQNGLTQLLSALEVVNRGGNSRSFEA